MSQSCLAEPRARTPRPGVKVIRSWSWLLGKLLDLSGLQFPYLEKEVLEQMISKPSSTWEMKEFVQIPGADICPLIRPTGHGDYHLMST